MELSVEANIIPFVNSIAFLIHLFFSNFIFLNIFISGSKVNIYISPVIEWITSEEDQVELCVHIVWDYEDYAQLWENTYLVYSRYLNKWVIDEMTVNTVTEFDGLNRRNTLIQDFNNKYKDTIITATVNQNTNKK